MQVCCEDGIEAYIEEYQTPLKETVSCVGWVVGVRLGCTTSTMNILTPGYLVDLVLDKEIDHGDDGGKESKPGCERSAVNLELS